MNNEWRLIVRGLFVAGLGAAASMLYIVGLSAAYVGRLTITAATLAAAAATAVLFRRFVRNYLDALDQRHQLNEQSEAAAPAKESTRV
jgi:membrane protein implicated in regulation of membrane protease activity